MIIDYDGIQRACNKFEQIFKFLESCAKDEELKVSKRTIYKWALTEYNKSEWSKEFPLPSTWNYEAFRSRTVTQEVTKS
jgi:hypothetical protein